MHYARKAETCIEFPTELRDSLADLYIIIAGGRGSPRSRAPATRELTRGTTLYRRKDRRERSKNRRVDRSIANEYVIRENRFRSVTAARLRVTQDRLIDRRTRNALHAEQECLPRSLRAGHARPETAGGPRQRSRRSERGDTRMWVRQPRTVSRAHGARVTVRDEDKRAGQTAETEKPRRQRRRAGATGGERDGRRRGDRERERDR